MALGEESEQASERGGKENPAEEHIKKHKIKTA